MPNFSAQFLIGPSGVVETTNAPAMRTLLGLGSASTVAASAFASASHNHAASEITSGTIGVARGGTGLASIGAGSLVLGNGTGAVSLLGPGAALTVPLGQGTSAAPIMANLVGSGAVTIAQVGSDLRIHAASGGGGGGGVTLPVSWIGMPSLTGFTPANGDIVSVGSASTTIFTVPTGKNMIYNALTFHNQNTAATTVTAHLVVGTTAMVLRENGSISATSSNVTLASTMVKAGEVLKATSSLNTNVNCYLRGYLVDDTVPLVRIEKFSGWSTGDNTLYTCPSGKIFVAVEATILPVISGAPCVMVYNPSGSARRVILNAVRSGGSPGVSNQLSTFSIAATTRSGITHSYFTLAAGDYISMNVPSTDDYEVIISGYEITV